MKHNRPSPRGHEDTIAAKISAAPARRDPGPREFDTITERIAACRDPTDAKFLELAVIVGR
jgi:hypothetical protein